MVNVGSKNSKFLAKVRKLEVKKGMHSKDLTQMGSGELLEQMIVRGKSKKSKTREEEPSRHSTTQNHVNQSLRK